MTRWCVSVAVLAWAATAAQAHFLWIIPDGPQATKARVIFSDSLEPDDPALLAKVTHTKFWVRDAAGKDLPLMARQVEDAYLLELPGQAPRTVAGVCVYGVVERSGTPFLLNYYPKLVLNSAGQLPTWDKLPLEIVRVPAVGDVQFQIHFRGKPVGGAEVVIRTPQNKQIKAESDAQGLVSCPNAGQGTYGVRARHVEAQPGAHKDKKYAEVRHYATLVLQVTGAKARETAPPKGPREDPAASRLLAEARAARAEWHGFPGFTAGLTVNFDGKLFPGKVQVAADGKVTLTGLDADAEMWARRTLSSIVMHRRANTAALATPCAFADRQEQHPLGRAILVLNDELHSSYRVRDRQISVVNREMGGSRFSITTLENRLTPEGTYLPATYVVHYWDAKTGQLQRTESHFQSWTRVGGFDLPVMARVITATRDLSTRSLTLSGHALLPAGAK